MPDGYAIVRVDSRGAGRSPGYLVPQQRAREPGLSRLHRVGGGAILVQRQSRPQRHFLLREQPVARGGDAAAASRGDLRVGRLGRQLPRLEPPRRHHLRLPQELAGHAGEDRAARRRRARREEPRHRRARVRPRNAHRGRTREEPRGHVGGSARASARRAVLPRAHRRPVESHRAAAVGRQLGRAGPAPARQFRRAYARGIRSKNGWRCTAARTGRRSTPITA